jgi:transposase
MSNQGPPPRRVQLDFVRVFPVSSFRTSGRPKLRDALRGFDPEESLKMSKERKQSTEAAVREIRRRTRRKFAPEEKVRIVLEGLRGEQSVSELCRREGIAANLYYRWSKDFLEAGKKQLAGDTVREATSDEVKGLRSENRELKEVVAEITLKNRVLKKSLVGHGEEDGT